MSGPEFTLPTGESRTALVRRARRMNKILAGAYPEAHCELDFTSPLELVVATVLSAQCTDRRVNLVTPALFARYPTAAHYASADRTELEELIRSTGFFRAKANSLVGLGQALCERFEGEVPGRLADLVTLPGVGRKTANVVLGTVFGIASGIVVDTHVQRLSNRLDLTKNSDPVKIEQDLMKIIPKNKWIQFSHQFIHHGRGPCVARKPKCGECNMTALCYAPDRT